MTSAATPDQGAGLGALARGIGIIQCFSATRRELSARELMELTGLPKPTLFRLLDTLCDSGLLRYSQRSARFVAGVGLLKAAAPVLARMAVRQFARPLMEDLADHIQGQIQLMVGHRQQLTYVDLIQGTGSKVFRPEIGTAGSIARTASGRAYLLGCEAQEREAFMGNLAARDPAQHEWLTDRLADAERDLADHGFCRGHGDLHREMVVLAVPMQQRHDDEAWIFSATVPVFSPESKRLDEDIGPRLITLVHTVEASFGNEV
ncbi:IclR family transcriptional regulator [soil metagenome]